MNNESTKAPIKPFLFLDEYNINTKKEESTDNDVVARILLQFGSAKLDFSFSKKKKHKKRG